MLESLKGVEARPTVQVQTMGSAAACGYRFAVGREYFVYAASEGNGTLTTGLCSRTRLIEQAYADITYARSILTGNAALGRISGRVVLRSRDLSKARDRDIPMSNVGVTLHRGGFSTSQRTDRAGRFQAEGLQAGSYVPTLDPPGRFRFEMPSSIELADARGCAELDATIYPDGRVTGRVTDSEGRPIIGLTVDLTVRGGLDESVSSAAAERLRSATGLDGAYEIRGVPPGDFVIGINTRPDPGARPEPRVFHPGVLRAGDAGRITMPAGGDISLSDFVLPASVQYVQVTGVVLDGAGAPVEGARVYLRGAGEPGYILAEPVITDFVGRFILATPADREYQIFAEHDRPGESRGGVDASDSLIVATSSGGSPVKLRLRRR